LQLTRPPLEPGNPVWSADGEKILFSVFTPKNQGAYVIAAEGGAPQQLFAGPDYYVLFPQWTPDAKSIVFQEDRQPKGSSNEQNDVEVLDVQTGKASMLVGSENLIAPALSPDGHFLAATTPTG